MIRVSLLPDSSASHDCDGCPIVTNRRTFLRGAALVVGAAALATVGVPLDVIAALPVSRMIGTPSDIDTATYPIPTTNGTQIDDTNQVILTRWQNAVYAFALSCPHQRTALRWDDADKRFQCPKHHSKYQPDGTFISGRATRNMDRYSLQRDKDTIVVNLRVLHKSSDDQTAWDVAVVKVPSTADSSGGSNSSR
jgi:Rieske Fe-S protein